MSDEALRALAISVTEDVLGGAPFAVGDIVMHPSGRKVEIVSGQYWSNGRVSNHWKWREVIEEGRGELEHGYGWKPI
jgi:hypothetical protein